MQVWMDRNDSISSLLSISMFAAISTATIKVKESPGELSFNAGTERL
jgi:hypothetical protein